MNSTHPTDTQLKQALAKMLPEHLCWEHSKLLWTKHRFTDWAPVRDTELLHLCWMVEETLDKWHLYVDLLTSGAKTPYEEMWMAAHASWQQRVKALAQVKGIEIV